MKPFLWFVGIAVGMGAGCLDEGVYTLSEAEADVIVREELSARGVEAAPSARVVDGLEVCIDDACREVALTLDGWDEDERVGFAYVTTADRGGEASTRVRVLEAEALQVGLDARREELGTVVVFREWSHETATLARDQFRRAVVEALETRGLALP